MFRVFSRQASNFVFPENTQIIDKKFIVSLKKQNNKNNLEAINKSLEKEEELNNEGKITKDYKKRIDRALAELTSNGKYLTPGEEGLDKLSPKFKLLLENVNKSQD